jgi:hypothetical protein
MRLPLLAAILGVLLLAPATAQMDFQQPYQVRGALGDIPSTAASEPAGTWNVEQRLQATHTNGTAQDVHLNLPAGASLAAATCSCPHASSQVKDGAVVVTLAPDNPSGPVTVTVLSTQPYGPVLGFSLKPSPDAGKDTAIILYVPRGSTFDAPAAASSPGTSTDGTSTIQAFTFDASHAMPDPFWATLHPGTATTTTPSATNGIPWLYVLGGLIIGALLWGFLVQRGVVQARGRKQVAHIAAHTEIAATESPAVLEGKKRALLAALKEVELAKQSSEMDTATYDAVKADFKKQAVTVMRALDETGAKKA